MGGKDPINYKKSVYGNSVIDWLNWGHKTPIDFMEDFNARRQPQKTRLVEYRKASEIFFFNTFLKFLPDDINCMKIFSVKKFGSFSKYPDFNKFLKLMF